MALKGSKLLSLRGCDGALPQTVAGMAAHLLDGRQGRLLSAPSGGGKALLVNGYRRKRSTTDPDLIEH